MVVICYVSSEFDLHDGGWVCIALFWNGGPYHIIILGGNLNVVKCWCLYMLNVSF